jgi:hypothetical protein
VRRGRARGDLVGAGAAGLALPGGDGGAGASADGGAKADAADSGAKPPDGKLPGYGAVCTQPNSTQADCPPGQGLVCLPLQGATPGLGFCAPPCADANTQAAIQGDPVCEAMFPGGAGTPTCGLMGTLDHLYYCAIKCPGGSACPGKLHCLVVQAGVEFCVP